MMAFLAGGYPIWMYSAAWGIVTIGREKRRSVMTMAFLEARGPYVSFLS